MPFGLLGSKVLKFQKIYVDLSPSFMFFSSWSPMKLLFFKEERKFGFCAD